MTPTFLQSLVAGGLAGTSVDLLFFPIDTVKTRLQSAQGFVKAGGFRGIYKGVGSVIVGSAPGAAVFFVTYDTLKQTLPIAPPLNHMLSASVGEVAACFDPRSDGSYKNPHPNFDVWSIGHFLVGLRKTSPKG